MSGLPEGHTGSMLGLGSLGDCTLRGPTGMSRVFMVLSIL